VKTSATLLRHPLVLAAALLTTCPAVRASGRAVACARLPVLTVPRTATPPLIDGDTSDAVWRQAAVIARLLPAADAAAAADGLRPTTVRVLWDARHLYVAFDCTDDEVHSTGTLRHDDDLHTEDVVEVFLDGVGDGRQFVEIQVAPDGTNLDLMYVYSATPRPAADMRVAADIIATDRWSFREWEMPALETAARRTKDGWSAELAIPPGPVMRRRGSPIFIPGEIRAHFMRYDHVPVQDGGARRLVQQNWVPLPAGNPHNTPALMGRLLLADDGRRKEDDTDE
jgi:hypothetical protein